MILQKFIENLRGNIRRYVMDKDPQNYLKQPSCVIIIIWQISRDHLVEQENNSVLEIIHTKNRTMEWKRGI